MNTTDKPFHLNRTVTEYEVENYTTTEATIWTETNGVSLTRPDDGMIAIASLWIIIAVIGFLGNAFFVFNDS